MALLSVMGSAGVCATSSATMFTAEGAVDPPAWWDAEADDDGNPAAVRGGVGGAAAGAAAAATDDDGLVIFTPAHAAGVNQKNKKGAGKPNA